MEVHIIETGNGIIVTGPMRLIRSRGQTRVMVGERYLDDIMVTHEIGATDNGLRELAHTRITVEVLEDG